MAGKRNARRLVKKMKREGQEYRTVVDNLIMLLGLNGITINFPWELTQAVEQLLQERNGMAPNPQQPQHEVGASFERLAQLTGATTPIQPMHAAPPPAPPPVHAAAPVDPWAAAAAGAAEDLTGPNGHRPPAAQPGPTQTEESPDQAQMKAKFEEGQARLMNRLETQGVRHSTGAGPGQGQRMGAHPSVKMPAVPPTAPHSAPHDDFDGIVSFGDDDTVEAPFQTTESTSVHPNAPVDDGSPRTAGGMSIEQARDLIGRATGKRPGAPGANPTVKPSGF